MEPNHDKNTESPVTLSPAELEKSYRIELFKFLLVLGMITVIALTNMFVRQQPLVNGRQYDFQSSFVFRNIYHDGEIAFKACFKKNFKGNYYVCFKFPPAKGNVFQSGVYRADQFSKLFVGEGYLARFIDKFIEKELELGRRFYGFEIDYSRKDLVVIPVYEQVERQKLDPRVAAQLQ